MFRTEPPAGWRRADVDLNPFVKGSWLKIEVVFHSLFCFLPYIFIIPSGTQLDPKEVDGKKKRPETQKTKRNKKYHDELQIMNPLWGGGNVHFKNNLRA